MRRRQDRGDDARDLHGRRLHEEHGRQDSPRCVRHAPHGASGQRRVTDVDQCENDRDPFGPIRAERHRVRCGMRILQSEADRAACR